MVLELIPGRQGSFFGGGFNPNSSPVSEVDGWKTEDYNFPHLFSEVASKASAL